MLVYRVFPYLESAEPGEPGHPLYEHRPQRGGRIDHPDYYVWYLARQSEAACGETFGNLARWTDDMFEFPALPGARKSLGTYKLPDDLRVCDLDDPTQLAELGLRPTQVISRNLAATATWGHKIWSQHSPAIEGRKWDAVQWWSFHRPQWTVLASWVRPQFVDAVALDLAHPAIVDAAAALYRPL
ncbi:RES family NAD+ phosphorylase [Gordonia lacunae]|uniref:RES family NAD+ phosphorylase n=1 Tax=Gordonia lacunae TaxID=417102 RepID=UPI0039E692F1